MRVRTLLLVLAVPTSIAGCDGTHTASLEIAAESASSAIPTGVNCGNAPELRQRAADDRGRVDESRSDHERISVGSRANSWPRWPLSRISSAGSPRRGRGPLKLALEAAHKAEATESVYEKTRGFNQASFAATRAIDC